MFLMWNKRSPLGGEPAGIKWGRMLLSVCLCKLLLRGVRMRFWGAFALVALVLSACTKPTEVVIPSDMSAWDKDLAPVVKKLGPDEQKLLQGYLMRVKASEVLGAALGKGAQGIPLGTTVGQAIAQQRQWMQEQEQRIAEENALKERLAQEAAAARAAVERAVAVVLVSKRQVPSNPGAGRYSDQQGFTIGVTNRADKTVTGVSGTLEFVDRFDVVVGAVSFRMAQEIQPGFDAVWEGVRDYNQFIKEHRAVWQLSEGEYTTRFEPDVILFADGTRLTARP